MERDVFQFTGDSPMSKSRWRQKYEAEMNEKMNQKKDEGEVIIPETE